MAKDNADDGRASSEQIGEMIKKRNETRRNMKFGTFEGRRELKASGSSAGEGPSRKSATPKGTAPDGKKSSAKKSKDSQIKEFELRLRNAQMRLALLKKAGASQARINVVDAQARRAIASLKKMRAEPDQSKVAAGEDGRKRIMRGENRTSENGKTPSWKVTNKGVAEVQDKYFKDRGARKAALKKKLGK